MIDAYGWGRSNHSFLNLKTVNCLLSNLINEIGDFSVMKFDARNEYPIPICV